MWYVTNGHGARGGEGGGKGLRCVDCLPLQDFCSRSDELCPSFPRTEIHSDFVHESEYTERERAQEVFS